MKQTPKEYYFVMIQGLRRDFGNNTIRPTSELIELKHIGEYLYRRLVQEFGRRNQRRLTIQGFAGKIRNLSIDRLQHKIMKALQNRRNNQCVGRDGALYHVQDVNQKGYEMIVALIKTLDRGYDGHGLGANFAFDSSHLTTMRRTNDTKHIPCISNRRDCRRANGTWKQNTCLPSNHARGFPGVHPHSGQKTHASRNNSYRLGSNQNSLRRGSYIQSNQSPISWRIPGAMRRL